jgi:catechol 2,3-dioxygenase-like lactoylglutathione lyase family enzyme
MLYSYYGIRFYQEVIFGTHKVMDARHDELSRPAIFDVGGVMLPRPFRIRRLGHFGFNSDHLEAALHFYRDVLGLRLSDTIDYRHFAPDPAVLCGLGDTQGYFLRYGTDHHAFVLFNRKVREALDTQGRFRSGVTLNQITWQVGSLQEVVDSCDYLQGEHVRMSRSGRDTPGSNWHTYFFDPDGHTVELYYGIEQIGWNGRSKPKSLYNRGFTSVPPLPQIGERAEVEAALRAGTDIDTGHTDASSEAAHFDVDGVLLPRPFAIAGIGPVRIFVEDMALAAEFYAGTLGLFLCEERQVLGFKALFFRANTEHHALAVYDIGLRAKLPVRQDTTTLSFGLRLATFSQLCAAVETLQAKGYERVALPPELSPGMRHGVYFADPDGHLVQLYFEMEQIGWDGRPRSPAILPNQSFESWPTTLQPCAETFGGEPFLGPWL